MPRPDRRRVYRCIKCDLAFVSDRVFLDHRLGQPAARRCVTGEELLALGFERDEDGRCFSTSPIVAAHLRHR